jgi:hypothetical protein
LEGAVLVYEVICGAAPLVQTRDPYQLPPASRTLSSLTSRRPMMFSNPIPEDRIMGSSLQ